MLIRIRRIFFSKIVFPCLRNLINPILTTYFWQRRWWSNLYRFIFPIIKCRHWNFVIGHQHRQWKQFRIWTILKLALWRVKEAANVVTDLACTFYAYPASQISLSVPKFFNGRIVIVMALFIYSLKRIHSLTAEIISTRRIIRLCWYYRQSAC